MTIVTVLIGLAIAAVLAEVLVRVFFTEKIAPRFVIDPGYGVRANQPNVVRTQYVPDAYRIKISTNSAGMRGTREYPVIKPDNVVRILVLGDSFIFGLGAEDHEVVSVVLEDILNSEARKTDTYEVINLAVSGFGQAEELVTYRSRGRDYKPDIVILFYFDNDIGNNVVANLFEVSEEGGVTRNDNVYLPGVKFRELLYSIAPIRWLFTHSQAWNLVRNRLSYIVQKSKLEKHDLKGFADINEEAVILTRELFRQFVTDIKADGAIPVVFVIPNKNHMESNFPMDGKSVREMGAILVDGRHFLTEDDYYPRDSHWNPRGHEKTARILARLIGGELRQNNFPVGTDAPN